MKRIQWKSFLMICFIQVVIVIALIFHRNIMQQDNKLDIWFGGFKYEEILPHPSGELNYYTDYYITPLYKFFNKKSIVQDFLMYNEFATTFTKESDPVR